MGDFPHSPTPPLAHSPARLFSPSTDVVHLDLAAWRALPLGLQRATIREAIHRLRASLRNINWEHVERAVWLTREGTTGQKATLAAGLELEIGYRTLRIGPEATPASPLQRASLFQPGDSSPGVHALPPTASPSCAAASCDSRRLPPEAGGGSRCRLPASIRFPTISARSRSLDCPSGRECRGSELMLRSRQPGDRFQPQGLDGHSTKLNEYHDQCQNIQGCSRRMAAPVQRRRHRMGLRPARGRVGHRPAGDASRLGRAVDVSTEESVNQGNK